MSAQPSRDPAPRSPARAGSPTVHGAAGASQHSRLLAATVSMASEDGCLQVKVGDLSARAGVSRATFYELFADKEDCFLAAQHELSERLIDGIRQAREGADAADTATAIITALAEFAEREAAAFNFLTREAPLAGPRAAAAHGQLIAGLANELERAWDRVPEERPTPDLPAPILLAGILGLLGLQIRGGQERPSEVVDDLLEWIDAYAVPRQARRWRTTPTDDPGEHRTAPVVHEPPPLPRGRHRLDDAIVNRVQRERLLYGTARAVRAKGCADTSVADIVGASGVSREVFYANFHNKHEALKETAKMAFEQISGATATAFIAAGGPWSEQVWNAARAFSGFLAAAPTLAHFAFVGSTALQRPGAPRIDDYALGFTVFLEDGYRQSSQAANVPRLVSQAIAGTVLETSAQYVREERTAELSALAPLSAFLILAPFLGTQAAQEFIDQKS